MTEVDRSSKVAIYTKTLNEIKILTWTNGDKPERSLRKAIQQEAQTTTSHSNVDNFHQSFTIAPSNKREDANNKLSDRILMSQNGMNPFFTDKNYVHDLDIEQKFLRPQNSNV